MEEEALRQAVAALEREVDAEAACRRLIDKRDPEGRRFGDRRLWQRLLRYLCGKGYAMDVARAALAARPAANGEEE